MWHQFSITRIHQSQGLVGGGGAYLGPLGYTLDGFPVRLWATWTLTPTVNLEPPIHLTCMCLDCGRKLENPHMLGENMQTQKEPGTFLQWGILPRLYSGRVTFQPASSNVLFTWDGKSFEEIDVSSLDEASGCQTQDFLGNLTV